MMSYLNVITLDEAKNYLRVDALFTADDSSIQQMIKASLQYVENYTGVMVYSRDKSYILINSDVRIYEWPITEVVAPTTNIESVVYPLYEVFSVKDTTIKEITLTVGIEDPADVPEGLKQVALQIINELYYGSKTGNMSDLMTPISRMILDEARRFIL